MHQIRDVRKVNVVVSLAQNIRQEGQGPSIVSVISTTLGHGRNQVEETAKVSVPDIEYPIRDVHQVNVVANPTQNVQQDQGPRIVNMASAATSTVNC